MPMTLYCDNKAAINIAHNPVQHDKTKHMEINRHFIKEKPEEGAICLLYIPIEEQVVDIFTKGLQKDQFDKLICKLGLEDIFEPI